MGETKVKIRVLSFGNGKSIPQVPVECVVDTGATLSLLPTKILETAHIAKEEPIKVTLADGRTVTRYYGSAILVFEDGNKVATRVLFGEKDDPALLGVVALETGGYTVDPIKGLIKREYFHQY